MERDWYCPQCGEREHLEPYDRPKCLCGLYWSEDRRRFGHYAVERNHIEAEELRHRLSRKLTRKLLSTGPP